MNRTKKEYGGFLPLELNCETEYYTYPPQNMLRFNCAKAAISFILNKYRYDLIYLPYYLCPNVCKEIENHGISVKYYHISYNLLPLDLEDKKGTCVYLVNYFGVMDHRFMDEVKKIKNAEIIIDNCHSFFSQPVFQKGIYNVYSCKKFFGVPDGAYLIAEKLPDEVQRMAKTFTSEHSLYLVESLERGTNYCYQEKKESDKWIANNYGRMSVLGEKLLQSVNYEVVKKRRHENFLLYHKNFQNSNFIQCEKESIPYIYPLNVGKNIKQELIRKKIYVPTLWGQLLNEKFRGNPEYYLSNETIFLPVDQRYNEQDIYFIVETVRGIFRNDLYK